MSYHTPVLLTESIAGLNISPKGTYIDATYGGGGHSSAILSHIPLGHLFGFDQDTDARTNIIHDERFTFINHNYAYVKNFMKFYNIDFVDGILADLGVSSHHLNEPTRGFAFRFDGDLDMRMNTRSSLTARTIVNTYSQQELCTVLKEYGEIKNAYKLAQKICAVRENNEIQTTHDLREIGLLFCKPHQHNKYLSQIFQALRIEVNNEIEYLKRFLRTGTDVLKPGGRFVIITYHSLEDRIVKNFFKSGNTNGFVEKDFYGNIQTPFTVISKKIITPSEEELATNNRARSAKLRIAEKK
ncbi:MAG: 16S rRNA (cytosine(1402)-N(4))-methyltransferase RsmH [Bacteroidales bacterium]